jgi:hypothetical protein
MRQLPGISRLLAVLPALAATATFAACSSSTPSGFGDLGDSGPAGDVSTVFHPSPDGSSGGDSTTMHIGSNDGGSLGPGSDARVPADGSTTTTTKTTIYAHTDTELYSMDPSTHVPTDLGTFAGTAGTSSDGPVTDLAVDAENDIYVCTESVVYQVTLPTTPGPGATVQLTKKADIKSSSSTALRIYALAFAPAGLLGTGETLVGGDSNGELWSIPTDGVTAAKDIGNFGTDPSNSKNFLALSGDLVFYDDAQSKPTGLATIRSCNKSNGCTKTDDYLAAIDIANLQANYAASTPSASLLAGIYGGTTSADGNGTGYGELFGLGAWDNDVYAFSRCISCYDGGANTAPAQLLKIDTTSGAGTVLASGFPFTDGWSGAGVTTKVTVTVVAPPMTAPPQ